MAADLDVARAVLGCLLLGEGDPRQFDPEDWTMPAHRAMHGGLRRLAEQGKPPEAALLWEALADVSSDLWAHEYALSIAVPCAAKNLPVMKSALRRQRQMRELRKGAAHLLGEIEAGAVPDEVRATIKRLDDAARESASRPWEPKHISEGMSELFLAGPTSRVPYDLAAFRDLLTCEGNLAVFGARPGTGKTAMLGTIAVNAARHDWPVLFFSLEMPAKHIRQRILAAHGEVPLSHVCDPHDHAIANEATAAAALPIWIDDGEEFPLSLESLCETVRLFAEQNLDRNAVVMIDYLQILPVRRPPYRMERRHEILGHVCRELKALSKRAKIPIIAAAQLSRATEQRTGPPQMSDLRESGEIEQTADQVILIHRQDEVTAVRVSKNRMGPTWDAEVRFNGPLCRFEDSWR